MEIMKDLFSDRIDYIQALRAAPYPLTKAKVPNTHITASPISSLPQIPSPPAPVIAMPPVVAQTTVSAAKPIGMISQKSSSGNLLKGLLLLTAIGVGVYLIRRYNKKRKEESR
jgi:hypothetical protein